MATTEVDPVEAVKEVFLECMKDGRRWTVAELQAKVSDELAQQCCDQSSTIVYGELPDPLDFGRCKLTEDALRSLKSDDRFNVQGPRGKEEVRLTAAALAALVPTPDEASPPEESAPEQPTEPAAGAEAVTGDDVPAETSEPTVRAEDIIFDDEFASLLPPRTAEEEAQLEQNLLAEKGARDALVVWKGHNVLIDGYGRRAVCQKHGLPCRTVERDFADRADVRQWILNNQRGRRNLTPGWEAYIRGAAYQAEKQPQGGTGANQHRPGCAGPAEQTGKSCHPANTEERLAAEFKVSPRTIRNDADFAGAVDTLAKNCGDEARQQILSRQTPLTRKDVVQLAKKEPEEQRRALTEATASGGKKTRTKSQEAPTRARATETTMTVPRAPQALAESLLRQLGRKAAAEVHQALGRLLGRQAAAPGTGRPKVGADPHGPAERAASPVALPAAARSLSGRGRC
jgi:hypothetical protein